MWNWAFGRREKSESQSPLLGEFQGIEMQVIEPGREWALVEGLSLEETSSERLKVSKDSTKQPEITPQTPPFTSAPLPLPSQPALSNVPGAPAPESLFDAYLSSLPAGATQESQSFDDLIAPQVLKSNGESILKGLENQTWEQYKISKGSACILGEGSFAPIISELAQAIKNLEQLLPLVGSHEQDRVTAGKTKLEGFLESAKIENAASESIKKQGFL